MLVIGDDFLGGSFEEEIYVQVATSSDVAQNCILLVVADDWCLRVGTSKEDSHELVGLSGFDQAERMHTGQLLATTAMIEVMFLVMSPHGPGSLTHLEA